ncbi:DsrE family protein [bacterium]|nr:DsrE family protein [bacterium]
MAQLGFVITGSPHSSTGARSFYLLASSALDKGHSVKAFFCEDGVYQCLADQRPGLGCEYSSADYLRALQERGAEIVVSSSCMAMRGVRPDKLCGIKYGTFDAMRRMLEQVDKVVCL